jgi:two-component system response regulator NreC
MRRSLRQLLDSEQEIDVIAEVGELSCIVPDVCRHQPDVLVLDLGMLEGSSRETIGQLRALAPETQIVMVTMQENPAFAQRTLAAGALGFVLEDFAEEELAQAIRAAVRGERYVSPRMAPRPASSSGSLGKDRLSARELEVLQLIALGHTNIEIAHKLDLSPRTIETHRARIHHKLGLRTRAELVNYALTRRLLRA